MPTTRLWRIMPTSLPTVLIGITCPLVTRPSRVTVLPTVLVGIMCPLVTRLSRVMPRLICTLATRHWRITVELSLPLVDLLWGLMAWPGKLCIKVAAPLLPRVEKVSERIWFFCLRPRVEKISERIWFFCIRPRVEEISERIRVASLLSFRIRARLKKIAQRVRAVAALFHFALQLVKISLCKSRLDQVTPCLPEDLLVDSNASGHPRRLQAPLGSLMACQALPRLLLRAAATAFAAKFGCTWK
mmetsp:Transcript_16800/g.27746  ORF Transcript_16800/g.27746 Transcript_16800/m.27746 type:complete len:244 (-) Transcript_16800:55-786(-)